MNNNISLFLKKNLYLSFFLIGFFYFLISSCNAASVEIFIGRGNVRSGPGTSHETIDYVEKGDIYKILETRGNWYKIDLSGGGGGREEWIHKSLGKNIEKLSSAAVTARKYSPVKLSFPYKKSLAVIIGISKYEGMRRLGYAVEDAKYLEEKVADYGFGNVITLYNGDATKANIIKTLKQDVASEVGENDRVLLFFAGRTLTKGEGKNQKGYLLPVDANRKNMNTVLSIDELKSIFKGINTRHLLFVIDSAISGLGVPVRKAPPYYNSKAGLVSAVSKKSIQVIAAAEDIEPMDPLRDRTIFVDELTKALAGSADKNRNGVITGNELGSFLRSSVSFRSNRKQAPHFGTWSGKGDMVIAVSDKGLSERQGLYETVYVPGGVMEMGSPGIIGRKAERPQHQVTLSPFYIGKYEVTNAQYGIFLKDTKHTIPKYWQDQKFNTAKQPVVGVTWHAASSFCKWLGKRLPTEAEWEKAARGGRWAKYPWGGESSGSNGVEKANMNGTIGAPVKVGSYKAGRSPSGAYDMAGNVWEWVSDWYERDYYRKSAKVNPQGPEVPEEENARIMRGGSWNSSSFLVRSSYRGWLNANYNNNDIGFRCAD